MRPTFRPAAAITAALLLAGGTTGCSMLGDDSGSSSEGGSSPRSSSSSEGGAAPPSAAGFDNATKPVAKGTFDTTVAEGGKVDIAIMGLKTRGRLATLGVQFTPRLPTPGTTRINAYRLNGEHLLGTSLIDPVNLKRYVVVKDSAGKQLQTDDIFMKMTNNQTTPSFYTFAAPPENVKSIDVQIGSWPTFRNIPVER